MKVAHIWEIPSTGGMTANSLYDRWGNLTYFADTTGLTEKTGTPTDLTITVKSHTASRYMRDPAPFTRQASTQLRTVGQGRQKGALPGETMTLVADAGLPGEERRAFQLTGSYGNFVKWLTTTAKMQVDVYSSGGALVATVPGATP